MFFQIPNCAYQACFTPSCAAGHSIVKWKTVVLHLLQGVLKGRLLKIEVEKAQHTIEFEPTISELWGMRSTTVLQPLPPLTSDIISHISLHIRSPSCKEQKQRNLWVYLCNSKRLIGWRDIWLAPTCKEEVLRFESQPPLDFSTSW